MATGTGVGGLVMALLPLVGIVTMVKARQRRKSGKPAPVDEEFEKRQAATHESERRMRAYLAQSRASGYETGIEQDEQETKR